MEIIIKPGSNSICNLREWWEYRELFCAFVWRDLKVRYKQTLLGVFWVLFQPVVTTAIFSMFFGALANIPSGNMPYPMFVFVGLTVWTFFSTALTNASSSLVAYEAMIKKVYFPRIFIPATAIVVALVDFAVTMVFLIFIIFYYKYMPSLAILLLFPLLVLLLLCTTAGVSFFTSALNVKYRDVRYLLPFIIQVGLFVTPIIYPLEIIADNRKWFLYINPLAGVVEVLRALIANTPPNWILLVISSVISLLIFFLGTAFFAKEEKYFTDIG